jgi:iron complex transport system ATP-binding protein
VTVLEASGLAVGYHQRRRGDRVVLSGLDLELERGWLTCLLGPNGSGKSTLLRTLAGMQPPLAGSAALLGDDVTRLPALERARRLAVVLTDPVDAGIMRAVDLVALGRYPHTGWDGRLSDADRHAVGWALRMTHTEAYAQRNVAELSDGERQRVLVARALAQQPAVLLLDEPTAFVDVAHRVELIALLRNLARDTGLAVLLSTHDLELAVRSADTLWLVCGDAVRVGGPEDLVLDGSIAAAFASDDVRFDVMRGAFVPRGQAGTTVRVLGEGPAATWAARALERAGLALVDSDADLQVRVGPGPVWELGRNGTTFRCSSLAELVTAAGAQAAGSPP